MVFFDSNVLVYIAINQDDRKKEIATNIVSRTIPDRSGIISLQVLREVANCMFRKSHDSLEFIKETIGGFKTLPCIGDSMAILDRGMDIKVKYGLQFYDALAVATAEAAHCDIIYSEDMGDGTVYEGIRVVNPFVSSGDNAS